MPSVLVLVLTLIASVLLSALLLWPYIESLLRWLLVLLLTKRLRTRVAIDALLLRRWSIEMRGILVENGPGKWEAPYAVNIPRIRVEFTFWGLLSVIFPPNLRLGPLEFHLGFRIKKVETIEVEGVSMFLEDAEEEDLQSIAPLKAGQLHKRPLSTMRPRTLAIQLHTPCLLAAPPLSSSFQCPAGAACYTDPMLHWLACVMQTVGLGPPSGGTSSSHPPGWYGLTSHPLAQRSRRPKAS